MAINETLRSVGLNDKQIRVYLALLKRGKMKPSELAMVTRINRATVYNLARELISKGLVTEDMSGRAVILIALPPENLEKMIEHAKREIREKESLIKKAVAELSLINTDKQYTIPKIRFVKEADLEKFLFDNTTKWQDAVISSDGIWWGFQDKSFAERFEKWIDFTWTTKESSSSRYRPQFFSNISPVEQKLGRKYPKTKREVRILEATDFSANVWVFGNYLVMVVTNEQPNYLIEIHDQMVAQNIKEVFKKLWYYTG